jgi:hypothetical protein
VYVIQRLVQRYCKKKRERKERQQRGISMLTFHNQQAFRTKGNYAFDRYQFPAPGFPRANVDYYYFFRFRSSCKMGSKVTKPKITVTETSGFKEEDHSWSIVNIHLACAVNTVLSICAVIFVSCLIVYVIQRLVQRYCKKKRERKERQQRGISMLPFNNQQAFGTKGDYAFDRYQFPAPVHASSGRFTDYQEPPPPSRATIHQLLHGLISSAPPPAAAVSSPPLPALPPPDVSGQQLGHPIPT